MYNCDYEYDILAVLRILKYLQIYKPKVAKRIAARYTRFGTDDVLMFLYEELDSVVDDAFGEYDEENDAEIMILWDKSFGEYISMTTALSPQAHYSRNAAEKKFEDIAIFFLSDRDSGIYDLEFFRHADRLYMRLILLNDYCEPDGLVLAITDLLLYIQKENERLRDLQEKTILCLHQNDTEEAA